MLPRRAPANQPDTPHPVQSSDRLLYESPSPVKIRVLTWILAIVMGVSLWAGAGVFQHMTSDTDPSQLAALSWRLALAAVIVGLGFGVFGGMLLYLRFYTTRLFLLAGGKQIRVETLRLLGRHEQDLDTRRISSTSYHHGKLDTGVFWVPSVNAPWLWIRVSAGRSFLLDAQGRFPEPKALDDLLSRHHTRPITGGVNQPEL